MEKILRGMSSLKREVSGGSIGCYSDGIGNHGDVCC